LRDKTQRVTIFLAHSSVIRKISSSYG